MDQHNQITNNYLSQIPFFSALQEAQLDRVVSASSIVKLDYGNHLFRQGESAGCFYLLQSGQMQLYLLSEEGGQKVMDIVHPGQMFAEAVMFMENQRYPVNAEAIQASQLVAFDIETFRNILKESVDTCFRLMASMSKRLHVQLNEIDSLSLHNATYRLVHYLLKSIPENATEQTELKLEYPKNILASRLAIKPETFSRLIKKLKSENIIDVHGNQIILRDVESLRSLLG